MATNRSARTFAGMEERAMKKAAITLVIATTLLTSPSVEARDRVSVGPVVSPTIAGLMASAAGCGAECGPGLYLTTAPAIFGYGYRATYYGNGFSYQPAYYPGHVYYATPRIRGCCRW
jgi:hypothetical protein